MTQPTIEAPPKLVWPKYALIAVTLFFTVCIVWTFKEVRRLQRAKAEGGAIPAANTVIPAESVPATAPSSGPAPANLTNAPSAR